MKKIYNQLTSIQSIFIIGAFTTITYFIFKTQIFLSYPNPIGDEVSFLKVFKNIQEYGFFDAWSSGNFSPVFYLVVYPVDLLINNPLITFRIISSLSMVFSLLLLYKFAKNYLKLERIYLISILIFSISFLAYRIYWQGINDSMFHLLIIASFLCVHNIYFKKNLGKNIIALGIILGLLIGTRFLAFLVLPGYLFFFYKNWKQGFIISLIALSIGILLHLPSIYYNNSFCSVNKNHESGFTWSQINYVSQKYIYEGKINDGTRINWEELDIYISKNGDDELPKTFTESIFKNPKWTIKELFNDFWYSIRKIYFPILGLGLFVLLLFPFIVLRKKELLTKPLMLSNQFIYFFWLYTFFISLVVLVTIEVRWYTAFIYLAILFYHQIVQDFKLFFNAKRQIIFLKLNLIVLMMFQGHFILIRSYSALKHLIKLYY